MAGPRAREISLFDRQILARASLDSVRKLSPRVQMANPVMFVVEVGSVLTTLLWLRDAFAPAPDAAPLWFTGSVTLWLWFTVLFANFAESVAEGRGKAQADTLRKMRKETSARRQADDGTRDGGGVVAAQGRRGHRRGRRADPRRRRRDRGRGERRRVRRDRRVGPGDPRERRRSLRGDGRHQGALRSSGRAHHRQPRRVVPRPDDRAGRGRGAPEDAERDRAQHPARRAHDRLPARLRDARPARALRRTSCSRSP